MKNVSFDILFESIPIPIPIHDHETRKFYFYIDETFYIIDIKNIICEDLLLFDKIISFQ